MKNGQKCISVFCFFFFVHTASSSLSSCTSGELSCPLALSLRTESRPCSLSAIGLIDVTLDPSLYQLLCSINVCAMAGVKGRYCGQGERACVRLSLCFIRLFDYWSETPYSTLAVRWRTISLFLSRSGWNDATDWSSWPAQLSAVSPLRFHHSGLFFPSPPSSPAKCGGWNAFNS